LIHLPAHRIPPIDAGAVLGNAKGLKSLSREAVLFLIAATEAFADADLDTTRQGNNVAVCVGSAYAGLEEFEGFCWDAHQWGARRVSPSQGANTGHNAAAAHSSIRLGLTGPNLSFCAGKLSMFEALRRAVRLIQAGRVDRCVVGGVETLSYTRAAEWLAASQSCDAEESSGRGAGTARSAAVMAEGAVAFIVEAEPVASARQAPIRATIDSLDTAFLETSDAAWNRWANRRRVAQNTMGSSSAVVLALPEPLRARSLDVSASHRSALHFPEDRVGDWHGATAGLLGWWALENLGPDAPSDATCVVIDEAGYFGELCLSKPGAGSGRARR
jgi:3-oxoacyl-(acyl-carrier-protein) synthase